MKLRTWNFGKKLGISSAESDELILTQIMDGEELGLEGQNEGLESSDDVYP